MATEQLTTTLQLTQAGKDELESLLECCNAGVKVNGEWL